MTFDALITTGQALAADSLATHASVEEAERAAVADAKELAEREGLSRSDRDALTDQVKRSCRAAAKERAQLGTPPPSGDGQDGAGPEQVPRAWVPLPLHTLPKPIADYCAAAAAAIGCDPAAVALPALAVLATAIGNSVRVEVKRGWRESSAVWACLIIESGGAKSPALDAACLPIDRLEAEARKRQRAELEAWKSEPKDVRGDRPQAERKAVSHTTLESLMPVHLRNPRSLILKRDELSGWFGSHDAYKRGDGDEAAWIELHGGRPVAVDRKSDAENPDLYLARPHVSLAGTIQPAVLRKHVGSQQIASGFAHRFTFALPPWKALRWSEAEVSEETEAGYERLIRTLYRLPYDVEAGPHVVRLSRDARRIFAELKDECADLIEAMPPTPLRSYVVKVDSLAARLALCLHVAAFAESYNPETVGAMVGQIGDVSGAAMQLAAELARWCREETFRVYDRLNLIVEPEDEDERILRALPAALDWKQIGAAYGVGKTRANATRDRLLEEGKLTRDAPGRGMYRNTLHDPTQNQPRTE